jgi:parallel beta-helix repeat protein
VQRAINVATAGDTVNIETGTYAGPVNVSKNLTIEGDPDKPIITGSATMTSQFTTSQPDYAVVYVAPGVTADIENLTVDGQGSGNPYGDGFYGVAFFNAAGTMSNVTVENIEQTPFNGVQGGVGVLVDNTDGVSRTVNVTGATITNYQKNGTVFEGAGLTVNMSGSTVTGAGTTGVIAQNGVEVARGAVGNITGNTITGNSYSDNTTAVSTGVILYQTGAGTNVSGNTLTGNDVGVYAISDAGNTTISNNNISGGAFDGIASDSNEVTITGNNIHGSAGDGVDLYDSENGSTVENNFITGNAGDGVYVDSSVTDTTTPLLVKDNDISGNGYAGLEDGSSVPVNADFNYWGSATGPTADNNPNGTGDSILLDSGSSVVSFSPWLTSGTDTDAGTPGFQPTADSAFGIYGSSAATEGATYVINFTPSMDITSYTVNYGDGTTLTYPAGTAAATHVFTEFGTYKVSSSAGTASGSVSSNIQVVVVGSASITATSNGITATEGNAFSGTVGSFTDAAGASSNPSDLSAVITWGDGATSSATLVETTPTSGVFTVSGSHTYAEYGDYTLSYAVTEAGATSPFASNTSTAAVSAATITPTATNITATEGNTFTGTVGSFTDSAGATATRPIFPPSSPGAAGQRPPPPWLKPRRPAACSPSMERTPTPSTEATPSAMW